MGEVKVILWIFAVWYAMCMVGLLLAALVANVLAWTARRLYAVSFWVNGHMATFTDHAVAHMKKLRGTDA